MNHMAMNGVNGVGGGVPLMNDGTNGATSRANTDQELIDYSTRLNTYIYDYFLRNEQYDCARSMIKCNLALETRNNHSPGRRSDGNDESNMDADSKDDLDTNRPADLPAPAVGGKNEGNFLLEWFGLFWDTWAAQRKRGSSSMAATYLNHTQNQTRMRSDQHNFLRQQPAMMPGNMHNIQNMLRMQHGIQPVSGLQQMNPNDPRQRAQQNNQMRNVTPQMMARSQQQLLHQQQQQMERGGSDVDINGQRPRTPSSGDNAPSPSKRARLDGGPQFPGQTMVPNGRAPPQGISGQQMMNSNAAQANHLLMANNINPSYLSPTQLEQFQAQNPSFQKKSIQVYAQNMAQHHRPGMPPNMPNQGSPMMPAGMDVGPGMPDYYNGNPAAMRMGPTGSGNQHALQDYQMQLMLLEQQNKKRLLMARQEQDGLSRGDGQPAMTGPGGYAQSMSPQGSRSGPSPNPSDQVKRGTPKMGPAGLPASPMPDGGMSANRGSPGPMNMGGMAPEMYPSMKDHGMNGMVAGPNGAPVMRAPSSHPQYGNGQNNPQAMEQMRAMSMANGGRLPNGVNGWTQPQSQAPMMAQPPQAQQPAIGTPRSGAMPPPPPTVNASNGRPSSPTQTPAPPTPSGGSNKAAPKKKDNAKERKRPPKKNSTAAATPSSEAEGTAPTPTPPTPITPRNPHSFTDGKNANGQVHATNGQAPTSVSAPTASIAQPMPDTDIMPYEELGNMETTFSMSYNSLPTGDLLPDFDFDSFLQEQQDGHDFNNINDHLSFGGLDGVEAGTGDV